MTKATEQTKDIAALLPEGLSESAVTEIASLVQEVITEQVAEKVSVLEAQVKGFIRTKIDELKEQALRELEEENETVKNAALFESVKTLMALEIRKEDEGNVISDLVQEQEGYEQEVETLAHELSEAFEANEQLTEALTVLTKKVEKLEGDKATLLEAVTVLEESKSKPFKSSEKAQIITENVDRKETPDAQAHNELLTPEVMAFMPNN